MILPVGKLLAAGAAAAALVATAAGPASAVTELMISTNGGVVPGGKIVRVTTLADSGPGSLREAIKMYGPRVVVFDVAGTIELKSDLSIENPHLTVAGQTAPPGGVVLKGGTLGIRTSNVRVEHIAMYRGAVTDSSIADRADGLTVYGRVSNGVPISNIVVSNVSIGWGVDENIGVNGLVDGIRFENSLMAEPLRNGGHPKGTRAMGLLFGGTVRKAEVVGNILAVNNQRSPRLTDNNQAAVINNYIYGYGVVATHIDASQSRAGDARIEVAGNVYRAVPDSRCGYPAVGINEGIFTGAKPSEISVSDNIELPGTRPCLTGSYSSTVKAQVKSTPIWSSKAWTRVAASQVYPAILVRAGSHPAYRNPVDRRIVQGIEAGTLRQLGSNLDLGPWPSYGLRVRRATVPDSMTTIPDSTAAKRISDWLCTERQRVSGTWVTCGTTSTTSVKGGKVRASVERKRMLRAARALR